MQIPHLKTSLRGAEAPTCPETSPWPTRSCPETHAFMSRRRWRRRRRWRHGGAGGDDGEEFRPVLHGARSAKSSGRAARGARSGPIGRLRVRAIAATALAATAPGARRRRWRKGPAGHRPAVPEEIICSSNSCMQAWVYAIKANHLGVVFIDYTQ